jgi:hypothetical protein
VDPTAKLWSGIVGWDILRRAFHGWINLVDAWAAGEPPAAAMLSCTGKEWSSAHLQIAQK